MREARSVQRIERDGQFVGYALEGDFVAEHECGIKTIWDGLGIPQKGFGVERRTSNPINDGDALCISTFKGWRWLVFDAGYGSAQTRAESYAQNENIHSRTNATHIGFWDEKAFLVAVKDKQEYDDLELLWRAFREGEAFVGLSSSLNPFGRASLVVAIASRIPKEEADDVAAADIDHDNLITASEKTGIEKHLKKAGKHFFALRPAWLNEAMSKRGEFDTKFKVVYWLNGFHDKTYGVQPYGWYTVEQLKAWAKNEGAVVEEMKLRVEERKARENKEAKESSPHEILEALSDAFSL